MYFYCYLFAGINIHYRGWSNGKYGYITMVNKNFVYRFVELFEDDNGHAYSKHVDPMFLSGFDFPFGRRPSVQPSSSPD